MRRCAPDLPCCACFPPWRIWPRIHVLRQFADSEKDQWRLFLVVDLEQSLPLFAAALNATDKLVQQHPDGADMEWLAGVQACLLNIELRMRELLGLLRGMSERGYPRRACV